MDHDQSYKLLFSHPRMVRDLLRGFVGGAWLTEVDFEALERVDATHTSDDLRARTGDIVWRFRWREHWVYLLVEFQSAIEPFMTVRVLTYVGLLYQDLIRARAVTAESRLPAVLPIVIYNGATRWRTPDQLSLLSCERATELNQFQVTCRFLLIDEGAYDDRQLAIDDNLVAMLFRIERARQSGELAECVYALDAQLRAPEDGSLRRAFAVWLDQVILKRPTLTDSR